MTTTLTDGTVGQVLDLPSGAQATAPVICVDPTYPTIRSMARQVAGTQGVDVSVRFNYGNGWQSPWAMGTDKSGLGTAWDASRALQAHFNLARGLTPAKVTFTGASNLSGGKGDYQIYNIYVDPRYYL